MKITAMRVGGKSCIVDVTPTMTVKELKSKVAH